MTSLQLDRIERLMNVFDVGPVELAQSAGLSYNFIYRLRKGERGDMSASNLAAIARALDTSTDYLLGLTDNPQPPAALEDSEARLVYAVTSPQEYHDMQRLVALVGRMTPEQRAVFLSFAETVTGGVRAREDTGGQAASNEDDE